MKDINLILGERIRQRRGTLKMTREQLAETIDVSPRFLADVESGKVGVSIETLKNIGVALNVSCDYLLGIDSQTSANNYLSNALSKINPKYYLAILSLIKELEKLD